MEYDSALGEGEHGFIPDSAEIAMRRNVMQLTKFRAVDQINKMTDMVDDLGKTVVMSSIVGEEIQTSSPVGVKMIMTRIAFSKTIGVDTTGDGRPDFPLRFEFDYSSTVIQFPLGFCPGDRSNKSDLQRNFKCIGEWGFVIKEWETITKVIDNTAFRKCRTRLYDLVFSCHSSGVSRECPKLESRE